MIDESASVHPSSIVDAGAFIGANSKIWHFSHICSLSRIGKDCNLGQNVYVDNNAVIGDRVKIQNNVSVYSNVEIEDDVFIGPSAVFTNVINPRAFIERKQEFKTTRVKRGATIGANATIVCGVGLGEYCFVGAGATVTENVPAYALYVGVPARQIGWVGKDGTRLDLPVYSDDECCIVQNGITYKLINNKVSSIFNSPK